MSKSGYMSYVTTTSGPVVPAKKKPIDVMGNIIANMQSKYKKGDPSIDWKDLAGRFNKGVAPRKATTIKDIVNKALTEAASYSAGKALFRLDLGNVVADAAHAKFKMNRKNHNIVVEMLYPNANENISIRFNVDDTAMKLFEVALDSPEYIEDFGKTVLDCCDKTIMEAEKMTEESDIFSTEGGYEPLMAADMRNLRDMCNIIYEDAFGGPDAFSAEASPEVGDDTGEVQQAVDAGEEMANPTSPMSFDDGSGDDESVDFRDSVKKGTANKHPFSLDMMRNMLNLGAGAETADEKNSSAGHFDTVKQKIHGDVGQELSKSNDEIIDTFLEYYPGFADESGKCPLDAFEAFYEWMSMNTVSETNDNTIEFDAWLRTNNAVKKLFNSTDAGFEQFDSVSLDTQVEPEMSEPQEASAPQEAPAPEADGMGGDMFGSSEGGQEDLFGGWDDDASFTEASGLDDIAEDANSELDVS